MTSLNQAFEGDWWETQHKQEEKEKEAQDKKELKESFEKTFPGIPFKELRYLWLDVSPPHYAHKTGIYLCYKESSGYKWTKEFPDQDLKSSPSLAFVKAFGMEENMIE
jgi:hypothetical protein